jgi:hypothetical protein
MNVYSDFGILAFGRHVTILSMYAAKANLSIRMAALHDFIRKNEGEILERIHAKMSNSNLNKTLATL